MGGNQKAETEVVRIKGRRQDKGGRVGEANQQGGRISPLQWVLCFGAYVVHASKPVPGCLKINNAVMTCR